MEPLAGRESLNPGSSSVLHTTEAREQMYLIPLVKQSKKYSLK